jgi:hypothetical protein
VLQHCQSVLRAHRPQLQVCLNQFFADCTRCVFLFAVYVTLDSSVTEIDGSPSFFFGIICSLPWQMKHQQTSTSSGFIIEGKRILTNAHSVENHTQVCGKKKNHLSGILSCFWYFLLDLPNKEKTGYSKFSHSPLPSALNTSKLRISCILFLCFHFPILTGESTSKRTRNKVHCRSFVHWSRV